MKRKLLQDVMGSYRLPLLTEPHELLGFQIAQASYFLEKMRSHESHFQNCFMNDDEKTANKQRERYIFNFAAFLNAARVFGYMMHGILNDSSDGKKWFEGLERTQPFRAFMIMRDANTHGAPLYYSLTYKVNAAFEIPLHGVLPSKLNVNLLPHMEVTEPPWITLDVARVQTKTNVLLTELAIYLTADERRNSVTYVCEEFIDVMRDAARHSEEYLRKRA